MDNSQSLSNCSEDSIRLAAKSLSEGNLVAFPTETVYGLGADATNGDAVARIYKAKGRPIDHPLIVHVHTMEAMEQWVSDVPAYAISLARDFWPGPMTLIMKRSDLAKDFITGGQNSVGIRVPNHPIALSLLQQFHNLGGTGVAAPSANRFGHVSATTSEAVLSELKEYLADSDLVLNGGQSIIGLESTIVDCTHEKPRILRPGAITFEMIEASSGSIEPINKVSAEPRVSGSLDKHYAPVTRIILDVEPLPGQGYIAKMKFETPHGAIRLLSPRTDQDFAQGLYEALRNADEIGLDTTVIRQPMGDGIAVAIRDRLQKASRGR